MAPVKADSGVIYLAFPKMVYGLSPTVDMPQTALGRLDFAALKTNLMIALRRLFGGFVALLVALVVLQLAAEGLGDPTTRQLGPEADDAARAALRRELGLDAPLAVRLFGPVVALLRGDLGRSAWLQRPIVDALGDALPVSARLAALALPIGLIGGLALGLILADRPQRWARLPLIALSVPSFVVAIVAVQLFAATLRWIPAAGYSGWVSLAAPALLMGGALSIKLGLLLQDRLRTLAREPFVFFAQARGLGPLRILAVYRLLPAAGLIARFGALYAGYLFGGALVIETVFGLPGLGRLAVLALTNRDLALLRGCMLVASLGFILARFAAETAQDWIDPRPSAAAFE